MAKRHLGYICLVSCTLEERKNVKSEIHCHKIRRLSNLRGIIYFHSPLFPPSLPPSLPPSAPSPPRPSCDTPRIENKNTAEIKNRNQERPLIHEIATHPYGRSIISMVERKQKKTGRREEELGVWIASTECRLGSRGGIVPWEAYRPILRIIGDIAIFKPPPRPAPYRQKSRPETEVAGCPTSGKSVVDSASWLWAEEVEKRKWNVWPVVEKMLHKKFQTNSVA